MTICHDVWLLLVLILPAIELRTSIVETESKSIATISIRMHESDNPERSLQLGDWSNWELQVAHAAGQRYSCRALAQVTGG